MEIKEAKEWEREPVDNIMKFKGFFQIKKEL